MFRVVKVRGKDAQGFLDRVTAGTVRSVRVGEGAAGALLTGQAKIIAQYDLVRVQELVWWLAAPAACAGALAEGLERLHFAEDIEIELTVREFTAASAAAGGARAGVFAAGPEGWASAVPGYELRTGRAEPPAEWEFDRIGAGVPWPVVDWEAGATSALEANMLFAIDRHKGCYPGQEVVERSLNVGHPARVLVAYEGEAELPAPGSKIALVPSGEGAMCSAARRGKVVRIFVRVPWNFRGSAPAGFRALAT